MSIGNYSHRFVYLWVAYEAHTFKSSTWVAKIGRLHSKTQAQTDKRQNQIIASSHSHNKHTKPKWHVNFSHLEVTAQTL